MFRDLELPNGLQDADLEMADLTRSANRAARLRKMGFCDHGWYSAPVGKPAKCHHCGKEFATEAELCEDGKENLI